MPYERYDIPPHSIHPKHLLRETTGGQVLVQASSGPTTAPNELWVADLCADEPHSLSGLAQLDGEDVHDQMVILYAGDGRLYQPSSGAWTLYAQQPSVGDGVLVRNGRKHAGTLHLVTLDNNGVRGDVHHSTAIVTGLSGPATISTTPAPIECTTREIDDSAVVSLAPLNYSCRPHRDGIYTISALMHYTPVGATAGLVYLYLYRNAVSVCMLDVCPLALGYVHMQGTTSIRLAAGDVVDLRLVSDIAHSIGGAVMPTYARVTVTRIG